MSGDQIHKVEIKNAFWAGGLAVLGVYGMIGFADLVGRAIDPFIPDEWFPRDSTDSEAERSGVRLITDYGTGCQYLQTTIGAITPRMNEDGSQVCGEKELGILNDLE